MLCCCLLLEESGFFVSSQEKNVRFLHQLLLLPSTCSHNLPNKESVIKNMTNNHLGFLCLQTLKSKIRNIEYFLTVEDVSSMTTFPELLSVDG